MAETVRARVLGSLAENQVVAEMIARGADHQAVRALAPRATWRGVIVTGLSLPQAAAVRTSARAAGVQAFLSRALLVDRSRRSQEAADVIVAGPVESLLRLAEALAMDDPAAGRALAAALQALEAARHRVWRCRDRQLPLGEKTLIMGILNATPDSFSGDGFADNAAAGLDRARQMVADGADILDIGGESTRPGSEPVPAEEEIRRVAPLVERIAGELDVAISIDTTKAEVADAALSRGAHIVNDISGLRADEWMAAVAAHEDAGVVAMHIQGTPRDMQADPHYADLMTEISISLGASADKALRAGIGSDQIVVDPGIGFGKTLEHNLEILRRLAELRSLGFPVLVGTSRKSSIGRLLGTEPHDRLEGTAATVALAIAGGADIVRVHDVKEMARVARVSDAILRVHHPEPDPEEVVEWGE